MLQTMAQLLSSLLPEEVMLLRKDQMVNAVIMKKENGSKIIGLHHVHRNQNTGQNDALGLPCVKKYP